MRSMAQTSFDYIDMRGIALVNALPSHKSFGLSVVKWTTNPVIVAKKGVVIFFTWSPYTPFILLLQIISKP